MTKIFGGGTPSTSKSEYWDGDVVWLSPSDLPPIGVISYVSNSSRKISKAGLAASSANLLPKGAVVYSSRASIGKVGICDVELATNQGFVNFICGPELNTKFLAYVLVKMTPEIEMLSNSTTFKEVSRTSIKNLEIPVPPLDEQKRIVSILDRAEALRRKRKEAIRLLDEHIKSVFLEMFGDPATNPKKLRQSKIKDMGRVVTGNTPPRSNKDSYGHHIEWIKSDNINNDQCIATTAEEWLSKEGASRARIVPAGSVLVTCIAGSKSCIGNSGLVDREVTFNQQINAIVPNEDIDSYFLFMQINLSKILFQKAATSGMKGLLSKGKFCEIELLNPKVSDQRSFADQFIKCENLRKKMLLQSEELDNQFSVLVQQAFAGNLVEAKVVEKENARKNMFDMLQVVGAVVEGFCKTNYQYGEMVIAKCVYLLQNVFDVPLGISFAKHNFGPYDNNIKKAVFNGIKQKYFAKDSYASIILGEKAGTLINKNYPLLEKSRVALGELLPQIKKMNARQIELLATICKIIQDSKSTDLEIVWKEMEDWKTTKRDTTSKADLLTKDGTAKYLAFIKARNWHQKLLNNPPN